VPAACTPLSNDPLAPARNTFLELEGRTLDLRSCFVGADPPANPVEGRFWLDSSAAPYRLKQYVRIDAGLGGRALDCSVRDPLQDRGLPRRPREL